MGLARELPLQPMTELIHRIYELCLKYDPFNLSHKALTIFSRRLTESIRSEGPGLICMPSVNILKAP